MKGIFLLGLLAVLLNISCRDHKHDNKIAYIKIVDFYTAASINLYNKGQGLGNFAYYEPEPDSFLFRNLLDISPLRFKTFVTNLRGSHFDDSLYLLIEALERYKDGFTFDTTRRQTDGAYCGPSYYVEYKKGDKIHYNYFILGGDDTLAQFSHFYNFMDIAKLKPHYVDNNLVDEDKEVVNAMTRLGVYEKMEEPYIPAICNDGIDKTKIFGSWRVLNKNELNHKNRFYKVTFTPESMYVFESVREDGSRSKRIEATFFIEQNGTTLVLKRNNVTQRHEILKLTDSCMILNERGIIMHYNKL